MLVSDVCLSEYIVDHSCESSRHELYLQCPTLDIKLFDFNECRLTLKNKACACLHKMTFR
jgi:hypothetical protein